MMIERKAEANSTPVVRGGWLGGKYGRRLRTKRMDVAITIHIKRKVSVRFLLALEGEGKGFITKKGSTDMYNSNNQSIVSHDERIGGMTVVQPNTGN